MVLLGTEVTFRNKCYFFFNIKYL